MPGPVATFAAALSLLLTICAAAAPAAADGRTAAVRVEQPRDAGGRRDTGGPRYAGDAGHPPSRSSDLPAVAGRDPILAKATKRGDPPALYREELELADTLGIGRVARDVAEHLPELEAMASYLDDRLGGLGFSRARPVIARDNAEMIAFLENGIVDVVSETAMSAMHFVSEAGASLLLRESRKGHTTYHSVLFVRDDSPLRSLEDLRSRRIAFEDPGSTAAFLLPLASIKRAGVVAEPVATPLDYVAEDRVGYFFALSEAAIVSAVTMRTADAGALSDEEWREFLARQPEMAAELRILHESAAVPRAFVVAGPHVSAVQADGLRKLFLAMNSDAGDVLQRYNKVTRFDPVADDRRELEATYAVISEEIH